jgi:hypothetical protein
MSFVVGNSIRCPSSTPASAMRQRQVAVGKFWSALHISRLSATRRFGLLPGTHNAHSQPRPVFKSYQLRTLSRPSFKRGARAQKTPAMPLLPRRKVRTGVICSTTDGVIGFLDRDGSLRRSANHSKGRNRTSAVADVRVIHIRSRVNPRSDAAPLGLTPRLLSRFSTPRR